MGWGVVEGVPMVPELETWGCPVGLILHIHPYAQIIGLGASSCCIFPRYLWLAKGKMVTFQWRVLVGTTVIKWLRWTSSVMTQLDITCLSRRCPESTLLLWHPFHKMPNFNLVMSKLQANPDWGTLYETTWPMLFQSIKVVKDKTGGDEMPWGSLNQNPINI